MIKWDKQLLLSIIIIEYSVWNGNRGDMEIQGQFLATFKPRMINR